MAIDANGQLKTALDASSITSGTLSISRLPLGDLDNRCAARSHTHDTIRADIIFTQDGTRWLFSDTANNTAVGLRANVARGDEESGAGAETPSAGSRAGSAAAQLQEVLRRLEALEGQGKE